MFGSLGWQELLIIFAILALLFGGSRVAGLFGALGKGVREFRTEVKGDEKKPDATASSTGGTAAASTASTAASSTPGEPPKTS